MPANPTVAWNSNHTKITVQNHTILISEYVEQVKQSLLSLSHMLDEKILFGIEFPSGSFDLPDGASETNDTNTCTFGLFTIPSESSSPSNWNDHPATFFLEKLCDAGGLCARQGDSIIWDAQRVNEWLLEISEAWAEALTLIHLLAIPGRGTEVTAWQYTNSAASPRHLFLSSSLQTFITQSNYNKTTAITGCHKYILRVIPFTLSLIVTKLLRIVRPIESLAFTSLNIENTLEIREVYFTYMFISHGKVWDGNTLSACLRRWFLRELDVPFGLHLHRHFAQALQQQFLRYEKDHELADVANEVMGHGREVADYNYAREGQDLSLDSTKRRKMEIVGYDWISQVHGIEVSPRDKGKQKMMI